MANRPLVVMFSGTRDRVVVVWDGKSPGSKRAREFAKKYKVALVEHIVERAAP